MNESCGGIWFMRLAARNEWIIGEQDYQGLASRHTFKNGAGNPNARLTSGEVIEIRELRAAGLAQRIVAVAYGISQAQVCRVGLHQNWR